MNTKKTNMAYIYAARAGAGRAGHVAARFLKASRIRKFSQPKARLHLPKPRSQKQAQAAHFVNPLFYFF